MGLFYLEYAVLSLIVVYLAKKITLEEIEKKDGSDKSNIEAKKKQVAD